MNQAVITPLRLSDSASCFVSARQYSVSDRWAIAAYIRALQLSQNATRDEVPAGTEVSNTPPNLNVKVAPPLSDPKGREGGAANGYREAEPK